MDRRLHFSGAVALALGVATVAAMIGVTPAQAAPGDLDPDFNPCDMPEETICNGKVTTDLAAAVDEARSVVLQPDGKIVVVGSAGAVLFSGRTFDFGVVRYNPDGSLDTGFGQGGKVTTDFGGDEAISGMAVQPDGKIVVAGTTSRDSGGFALARYNPDGTLDTSFGDGGRVITHVAGGNSASALALQPDGKIIVAGFITNFLLVRYNPNGSLDEGFGEEGMVITTFFNSTLGDIAGRIGSALASVAHSVVLQPDGKIVAAGGVQIVPIGVGGLVAVPTQSGCQPARSPGFGQISSTCTDFALARYNPDGSLDTSFGRDGLVTTDFAGNLSEVFAIALQPDGKIVAAGKIVDRPGFALARYNPDGSLDTSFGRDGLVTTGFGACFEEALAVVLQPDGKIVAAGGGNCDFAVARYLGG
jgi:uncharacterized delta-60 repeat protein